MISRIPRRVICGFAGRLEELQHLEIARVARIEHLHQELPKTGKILAFLKEKLYSLKVSEVLGRHLSKGLQQIARLISIL